MKKDIVNDISILSLNNEDLSNYRENLMLLRRESSDKEVNYSQETNLFVLKEKKILSLKKTIIKKNKEIAKLKELLKQSLEQNEFLDQEVEELRHICIEENQNTLNERNLIEEDMQASFLENEKYKIELGNRANSLDKKEKKIERINSIKSKFSDCFSLTETDIDM